MSDEKKNMASNIGEMLTAAREEKGLSISTAALQCNLDTNIIEKLEGNRFSEVGAPVFTRGYLTLYARCLGLSERDISEAFNKLRATPTPALHLSEANIASQSRPLKRSYSKGWLWLIPLLIVCGILLQQLMFNNSWLLTKMNQALMSGDNSTNTQTEITVTDGTKVITETPLNLEPEKTATISDSEQQPIATETVTTITPPADNNPPEAENKTIVLTSAEPPAALEPTNPPAEPEVVTTNSDEAVKLYFKGGESWVQIDDKNKKIVRSGLVKKGETITLPASGAPYDFNFGRPQNIEMSIYGKNTALNTFQRSGSTRRFKVSLPNG